MTRNKSPRPGTPNLSSPLPPDNGAVETLAYLGTYYQLAFFNVPYNARSVQFGSEGKPLPVPGLHIRTSCTHHCAAVTPTTAHPHELCAHRTLTPTLYFTLILYLYKTKDHVAPAVKEAFDFANDFPSKAHHITRWFGLHRFVLFSSTSESGTSVNEANLLLSSLAIAFDAIKW